MIEAPDPSWPHMATQLIDEWSDTVRGLIAVHHIGSTSVFGLPAKPVIDLLPVFETDGALDAAQRSVEAMGYEWLGEYGLPGRRYARRNGPDGHREVQVHCYALGSPEITRHLAFRDALRGNAGLRAAYTSVKARCAALHAGDPRAYGDCKSSWIKKVEARALERLG
ncbi:MAG: GrpB family protein [Pseudomonadota bacterium]